MSMNTNQPKDTPDRGNVLIVDDNPENLRLLRDILNEHGYTVRPAASGKLAIQSVQRKLPDIILLDIRMPEMNGYEVCRILKENKDTEQVPVIFISALAEVEDKVKAFQAGGVDYLTKPFHETEVLARVATHLSLYKMQQNLEEQVASRTEELQAAYERMSQSEYKYRSLFNDALDMIHIVDQNGIIFDANPIELKTLGYAKEEYFGKPLVEIIHPEHREETGKVYRQVLEGQEVKNYETVLVAKNGDSLDVEVNVVPLIKDGEVLSARAISRDISERKRALEQIKKSKEEWERSFEAIGDIATIQDLHQRIIRVNRKACEVFSAHPEELEGKLCYEVFRGVDRPCDECPVLKSIADFEIHTAEIQHEKLGKIFSVSASPFFDEEGQVSGIVHFAKDITRQKSLENQLRQAQKMEAIGTLAGGIAHDFNNILSPILGYADMALETIPADSPLSSDIHQVLNAANRARDLVRQILSFSRQVEHEVHPLKVQFVIKEALKLLRASIPTTIEIRQNIDQECAAVLADPTQVHQVIMNLCTNAYQSMRERGGVLGVVLSQVELGSADLCNTVELKPGTYVMLEVSDTGHGMSQDVVEKIFDPYFTTKGKGEGTGLGLSVVHGIVKSLCGEITVVTELEQGTSFCVYLPVIETEPRKNAEKISAVLPSGNERILIVDDEKEIIELQGRMLESLGYQVTRFTNCEEALQAFQSKPDSFDLIITDMTMPRITGIQLAKDVLAIRAGMPIILCTGFSELISEEKIKSIGIHELLMKPVIKKDLALVVRKVLGKGESVG